MAIALPPAVAAVLAQLSHTLAQQMPDRAVRWVKPDRMHLTLRFLGDTAVAKLSHIVTELDGVTANYVPFQLHLYSVGCFPNRKRSRVIWVGLRGELDSLTALKRDIDTFLQPMGWEREKRPFQAHLTLGRVKNVHQVGSIKWDVPVKRVEWNVTAVHLIESQLRPQGPIYTTRHSSQIKS